MIFNNLMKKRDFLPLYNQTSSIKYNLKENAHFKVHLLNAKILHSSVSLDLFFRRYMLCAARFFIFTQNNSDFTAILTTAFFNKLAFLKKVFLPYTSHDHIFYTSFPALFYKWRGFDKKNCGVLFFSTFTKKTSFKYSYYFIYPLKKYLFRTLELNGNVPVLITKTNMAHYTKKLIHFQQMYCQPREICLTYTVTNNNIIVNCWNVITKKTMFLASSARLGFKGKKKTSLYAYLLLTQACIRALDNNLNANFCLQFKLNPFFTKKHFLQKVIGQYNEWLEGVQFHSLRDSVESLRSSIKFDGVIANETSQHASAFFENIFNDKPQFHIQMLQTKVFNGCRNKKMRFIKIQTRQQRSLKFSWYL